MIMARILLFLLLASLVLFSGCGPSRKAVLLDEYLSGDMEMQVRHHQLYVTAGLRDPSSLSKARKDIFLYLQGEDGYDTEMFSTGFEFIYPMRPRDYWALILAKFEDEPLILHRYDDNETRDKRIEELLQKVGPAICSQ